MKRFRTFRICFFACLFFLLAGDSAYSQLAASFSANPLTGCAPLIVQFKDESTGNPSNWRWDLGNGTVSFLQNPAATYFNPGTYTVKLVVRNGVQADSVVRTQYITVYQSPSVNFTSSDSTGCYPLQVQFRDFSNAGDGTIVQWLWDFGDGDTSSLPNPQHTYTSAGNYNVSLQITNSRGCVQSITKLNHIRLSNGVEAGFLTSGNSNCRPPTTIQFTNTSTGTGLLNYEWFFGDGSTSTQANPTHSYTSTGNFTVKLIVKNNSGCVDSIVINNAVVVGTVQANFTAPASVCEGQSFQVINNSAPTPVNTRWDWGDGSSSSVFQPAKTYSSAGSYQIKLVSDFGACKDSIVRSIQVNGKPTAQISASNRNSCRFPLQVAFTASSNSASTYKWFFGDGDSSTLQNPTHIYNSYGRFTVRLVVTNAAGCSDTLVNPDYIQIQRPQVSLQYFPIEGCAPYSYSPTLLITTGDSLVSYLWDFGDGSTSTSAFPVHIYPNPGTYTVKLFYTTFEGCSDSLIVNSAVRLGSKPIVDFVAVPPIACAFQPISFQDRSTGAPGDRWLWRFGDGGTSTDRNPEYLYQDTGWFNVTLIVWNNGCSDSLTIPRFIFIRPPIARFIDSSVCSSRFTKWFIDRSIGATQWYWDFGDGSSSTSPSPSHTYSQSGLYLVTLTVKNDTCEHSHTQQIVISSETAKFRASDTTVCKGSPVSFISELTDRTTIRNYEWDFGDGVNGFGDSIQHTFNKNGKYTIRLIITDINGCTDTLIKPLYIEVTGPTANFKTSAPAICSNSPVLFLDSSFSDGVHPIRNWIWDYGDGTIDTLTSAPFQHSYDSAGSYSVTLTVLDSNGCTDRFQRSSYLLISKPDVLFQSPDTLSCTNQPIRFINQTTGNGPIIYSWSFGNNSFSTAVQPLVSYTSEGVYTVRLLATDQFGCTDSFSRNNYITIKNPRAFFTVSDSVATCPPLVITFNNQSQNFNRFQWDFGDGTRSSLNNPTHFYTYPGVYRAVLRITSPGNCMDSMVKTIVVRGPQGTFRYDKNSGCEPTNIQFTGMTKDTVSFVWDFDDGTVTESIDSIISHTYNRRGFYLPKMILKDPGGCQVSIPGIDTVKIYGIDTRFVIRPFNFCDSGMVNFVDSTSTNDRINSYQWNFGDGTGSALQNPSHFYQQPGTYPVQLVVRTQNGCSDTASLPVPLSISRTPNISMTASANDCVPATANFTVTSAITDSSLRWKWNFGNGSESTQQIPNPIQYTIAGTYPVQVISTNGTGCSDTAVYQYTAFPIPNTNAGPDQIVCFGTGAQLNATGADTYRWSPAAVLSCQTCSNPVLTTDSNLVLAVEGKNIYGCSTRDSVLIRVQQPFNISVFRGDTLCVGETIQLFARGTDQYEWSPAVGLNNPAVPNPIAKPSFTTLYQVIGRDRNGCFADTGYVPIQVYPYPTVNAGPDQTIQVGNSIPLRALVSPDIVGIQWLPSSGLSCSNCVGPVASPGQTTNYQVEVKNLGGCISRDDITVFVFCNNSNLFVPNTFSPNADGNNDVFYPRGKGLFTVKTLRIFNRWGELVFEKTNFSANDSSKGWNGTYLGNPASQDVYVYTIEVMCENQTILKYGGNIALIR